MLVIVALLIAISSLGDDNAKQRTEIENQNTQSIKLKTRLEKQDKRIKQLENDFKKLKKSVTSSQIPTIKQAVVYPVVKGEIADYIRSKFGSNYAVAIAKCESGLNPLATGSHGERGVFQIHPVHISSLAKNGFSWDDMYNWKSNIDYARMLYGWQGWSPWSCRFYV